MKSQFPASMCAHEIVRRPIVKNASSAGVVKSAITNSNADKFERMVRRLLATPKPREQIQFGKIRAKPQRSPKEGREGSSARMAVGGWRRTVAHRRRSSPLTSANAEGPGLRPRPQFLWPQRLNPRGKRIRVGRGLPLRQQSSGAHPANQIPSFVVIRAGFRCSDKAFRGCWVPAIRHALQGRQGAKPHGQWRFSSAPRPILRFVYQRVRRLALKAHHALGCRGVTRADFRYVATK